MAHFWTDRVPSRTFLIPLAVALPVFFLLGCLAQGFFLLMTLENQWENEPGSMWHHLQEARKWVWLFGALGGACGVCWAWIILLPLRRLQQQLNHFADFGSESRLEFDHPSELSFVAIAFNRALQEVEKSLPKRAQSILSSVTSGIVVIDVSGLVEWMNPYACRLFPVPEGNLEGRSFTEVLSRSSGLVSALSHAFRERVDLPRESVTLTDKYGETRKLSAWMVWVQDEDNVPVGMVLTVIDDTRLQSFTSGIEGAERASYLRHMASGIVHEIRNPLTPIRGLAQILAGGKDIPAEKLTSYSKVIVEAVDRVNQVVDRLSMLTKPLDDDFARTRFLEILFTVRESTAHLSRKAKVAIEIEMEDESVEIVCQPELLAKALTNIVINAIEASPAKNTVRVSTREVEGKLAIDVENLGSSIPPGDIEDLFLPFHTTKKNGTGLGLPISDSIVKSHGGTISVKSGNNRTTFSISIPMGDNWIEPSNETIWAGTNSPDQATVLR